MASQPVFADPFVNCAPAERWVYWLTRCEADGALKLHGLRAIPGVASEPVTWKLGSAFKANLKACGLLSLRTSGGLRRLVIAFGKSIAAFPPLCPLDGQKVSSEGFQLATSESEINTGSPFAEIGQPVALPAIMSPSRDIAFGLRNGAKDRCFLRATISADRIRLGVVQQVGMPIGTATFGEFPVWIYQSDSHLGRVNTMDQSTSTRDLQPVDLFQRARVSGRVVALSGQNQNGRPILRVYDLLSRKCFHHDDAGYGGDFSLPVAIGHMLFSADRVTSGDFNINRHSLVVSDTSGVRS